MHVPLATVARASPSSAIARALRGAPAAHVHLSEAVVPGITRQRPGAPKTAVVTRRASSRGVRLVGPCRRPPRRSSRQDTLRCRLDTARRAGLLGRRSAALAGAEVGGCLGFGRLRRRTSGCLLRCARALGAWSHASAVRPSRPLLPGRVQSAQLRELARQDREQGVRP